MGYQINIEKNDASFLKCLLDWYLEGCPMDEPDALAFSGFTFDEKEREWALRLRRMMREIEQRG